MQSLQDASASDTKLNTAKSKNIKQVLGFNIFLLSKFKQFSLYMSNIMTGCIDCAVKVSSQIIDWTLSRFSLLGISISFNCEEIVKEF